VGTVCACACVREMSVHRHWCVNVDCTTRLLYIHECHSQMHLYSTFHLQGVSAAFSAPLLGGIPVTHRGVANQVVMCTGYGREGTSPDLIRYHEEQTVVFLMAVGRLRELCDRLVNLAGYPIETPVAIVEKAGCPDQRTVVGDMRTIAGLAELHKVQPPSTIVVGEVVNVLLPEDQQTGQALVGLVQNMTASV
jgi:siroheme synthase